MSSNRQTSETLTIVQRVANKKVAERFGPHAVSQPDMLGSFIRHGLDQEEASRESCLTLLPEATLRQPPSAS